MCGIAGIINFNGKVELSSLKKMTDSIVHRGPDGEGHWLSEDKQVGFGHRRLSIIDLSENGKQPMHYLNNRYTITYNGEIYNYLEIKEDLLKKGYTFHSSSDTEVLLALYDLKKEKCLDDLDGMFSFAIWDEKEKLLFCARDRFGEKPFYYLKDKEKFIFASEIKQFWVLGISKQSNNIMFYNFLKNKFIVSDYQNSGATFFSGINKLPKSHYLVVKRSGELILKNYWKINLLKKKPVISIIKAREEFVSLMETSVKRRLRSDVPVGSSLSGGLDSSTIVCLINNMNPDKSVRQNTFSARFKDFDKDEGSYMEKVVNNKPIEPHYVFPDEENFINDLEKLIFHQDEPFGTASIYAQYCVMKLAKENNVTVLLDGQGADECLAGYHYYYPTYYRQLFENDRQRYFAETRFFRAMYPESYLIAHLDIWEKGGQDAISTKTKIKKYLSPVFRKFFPIKPFSNDVITDSIFTPEFKEMHGKELIFPVLHSLDEMLYHNTMESGLEDLLRFADRNSMAHSREVRLPFLNHQLVEFIFSLPEEMKIHEGWTKFILRTSFKDIVPEEITWRMDKIGYEPPEKKWISNPKIGEMINESFLRLEKEKILKPGSEKNNELSWPALITANLLFH